MSRRSTALPITEFLNVDLELASRGKLDTLIDELAAVLFVQHREDRPRDHQVSLQATVMTMTADATVRALVAAVKRLSPAGTRQWRAALRRDFNLGVQAGLGPSSVEYAFEPRTVRAVADLGARIVVTVYGAAD